MTKVTDLSHLVCEFYYRGNRPSHFARDLANKIDHFGPFPHVRYLKCCHSEQAYLQIITTV